MNEVIENLLDKVMVSHKKSDPYHPQANGQDESTNKILKMVLTKIVSESKTNWELKLHSVVWAYRVAYKTAIGITPFNMVYGLDAILPLEFLVPTLWAAQEIGWMRHNLSNRVEELEKLDETRLVAIAGMYALKRRQKQYHDHHIITKRFKLGDLVLVFTVKKLVAKLSKRGKVPYMISRLSASVAVKLSTLEGEEMPKWISGCRLKK